MSLLPPGTAPWTYVPLDALGTRAHVVVDGAARPGTRLTLSHWPASPTPPQLGGDTSTEIVLAYLADAAVRAANTPLVATCDHLDEDGACALFCLCAPTRAAEFAARLTSAARAGDFDVVEDRAGARVAFALRHLFDPSRSPLRAPTARWLGSALRAALEELPGLLAQPEAYAAWWADEDAAYAAGCAALESGAVAIERDARLELAIVTGRAAPAGPFARAGRAGLPLSRAALHSTVDEPRILVDAGGALSYYDRYETWVRYRSRELPARRDLAPLAAALSAAEPGEVTWTADPPSAIVPVLAPANGARSALALSAVRDLVSRHLESAPPAWSGEGPPGLSGPGRPTAGTSGRGPARRRGRPRSAPSA